MTNKKPILLKVRNLKKYFKTPSGVLKAIDDVSFDVKQGEIIGLIGESGSGKTTVGRCLIRLYEEFSGFVSLEEKAISGSKLTKKKKRFLNQNMQMIFQDPHASLNGQQNIYTILKEPLVVNKIMKQEYEDFFKDWQQVIENFKYTFSEEVKKIELDTIKFHTLEANKFFLEWNNIFRKIKFNFQDIENDFNQYFAFKLSNQEREGNVISKIFSNNSKILDLYFTHQKEWRNDSILFLEQKLKEKKEIYETKLNEVKRSNVDWKKQQEKQRIKEELGKLKRIKKSTHSNHLNIIDSYLKEFKNSYVSHLEAAQAKLTIEEYNDEIKFYVLSKKMHSLLNSVKKNIIFLTSETIDNLINQIKKYHDDFLAKDYKKFKPTTIRKYRREFTKFVDLNFVFDFKNYLEKSLIVENRLELEILELKKEYLIVSSTSFKSNEKTTTHEELERAKQEYLSLKEQNEKHIKEYEVSYNKRMEQLELEINSEKVKLDKIREDIKKINEEFNKKHIEFLEQLKNHLILKGESKKQIKNQLLIYENKVKLKNETLEAFDFEILNLKKDFIKLKHLLGLNRSSLSKKYIKNILMREKIYNALEEVGLLRQFAWRYPHEFSGGQRQRIVIARALISNPKIIIADEPIASLDVSIQAQVVNLLKELCEKKNVSLIFIAHDLSMVEYIADKILIMHLGKIVEFGKTEEIYSNPLHPYTKNLFNSVPKISNANDKFESSNFELDYLDEQHQKDVYVDFFELNKEHIIYSTISQFEKWTNQKPMVSEFTKYPKTLEQKIKNI